MKLCAQSITNPEFTLCGDAYDLDATDTGAEEFEPFRMVRKGERVNCPVCLRAIKDVYETFTINGRHK